MTRLAHLFSSTMLVLGIALGAPGCANDSDGTEGDYAATIQSDRPGEGVHLRADTPDEVEECIQEWLERCAEAGIPEDDCRVRAEAECTEQPPPPPPPPPPPDREECLRQTFDRCIFGGGSEDECHAYAEEACPE